MVPTHPVPRRRRRWPLVVVILLIAFGALGIGARYYGAGFAEGIIEGWQAREAQAGRVYGCATQTVGGFPFGVELRCADASAEFKSNRPPLALTTKDIVLSFHLWQPTVLKAELIGPGAAAASGQPAEFAADWRQAHVQVHGLPTSPESARVDLDGPVVDRANGGDHLFKADRLGLDARMVSGTVQANPVIEVALKLVAASSPAWHSAAAIPADADVTVVLRGLKDFAPKPLPQRFRELQAAGGRIEIKSARVQQRDTVAIASGALGLSPAGRLDGQLRLTVANLDKFLPELHLDSQEQAPPQVNNALSALDRFMPGLGNVVRKNAGPLIVASANLMGQPAQLEGKPAVMLPLRFDDGMVSLGPLKLGATPPLY